MINVRHLVLAPSTGNGFSRIINQGGFLIYCMYSMNMSIDYILKLAATVAVPKVGL